MNKQKTIKKLAKLKIKYNDLLLISLSDSKLAKYKEKYNYLIIIPFLLCVIHFTVVANLIVALSPFIKSIIGATLIIANVVCPMIYSNYKDKCEILLDKKMDKISKKIKELENILKEHQTSETIIINQTVTKDTQTKKCEEVSYTEEDVKDHVQELPVPINSKTFDGIIENIEEHSECLPQEQSGPRLVKKLLPQDKK